MFGDLPSNSTPTKAIGIWWATPFRFSSLFAQGSSKADLDRLIRSVTAAGGTAFTIAPNLGVTKFDGGEMPADGHLAGSLSMHGLDLSFADGTATPFFPDPDRSKDEEPSLLKNQGICVILNLGSGKRDAKSQPESIRAAFAVHGAEITLKVIKNGAQLLTETKKSLDEGYKTIVAAGGDGTICSVAQSLSASKTVMGILPLGTFNYFARSLDIPMDIEAAAKVIVDGHTRPLRVATVNDRMFLNNASLGTYPAILANREEIYRRWGRSQIAAYWAVIKTLVTLRRPLRLRLTVDGKSRDLCTPFVFIVNNAYQLQQMSVQGADQIEAGELAVLIAPDAGRIGMIRLAAAVALGRAAAERNFELLWGRDIDIESIDRSARSKRTIAKDGERERIRGPFRFRVVKNALRVLVPADRTAKLR